MRGKVLKNWNVYLCYFLKPVWRGLANVAVCGVPREEEVLSLALASMLDCHFQSNHWIDKIC
jgi:hypothetical protein